MSGLLSKIPKPATPVGASATAAAVVNIIMWACTLWKPWAHVPAEVRVSVQTILTGLVVYLAGWWNVVRSPGQEVTVKLTPSPLPTVQAAAPEDAMVS